MEEGWLQVWCYSYWDAITPDMSADQVPLLDMHSCTVQLYQTCMLGSFIQMHVFVKYCSIRQCIWSITNPSDMPTGRVPLPQVWKTCRLPSWMPSWIYKILNDVWIASLGCYNDNVCNSRISKSLHANPWSLPVSWEIFLYFCNTLPSWRPFCPHYYVLFLFGYKLSVFL